MDEGYVVGTDDLYDRAYFLEAMANAGCRVDDIVNLACELFSGVDKFDAEHALRCGGTKYLAECYRNANGFSFRPA